MNTKAFLAASLFASASLTLVGCKEHNHSPSEGVSAGKQPAAKGGHDHDHDHDHGHTHGGIVIALGESAIGPFTVKATRDDGPITPGKDTPIDITVTTTAGAKAQVAAVRFWIGTQDAKGSVKAKGEVEDPKQPNRYHTHAEIPSPLPEGSRLWVEVEDTSGEKHVGGFDLKG